VGEDVKEAAIILCKIVNNKGTVKGFREKLINDVKIKPLFDCEYYTTNVLLPLTNTL